MNVSSEQRVLDHEELKRWGFFERYSLRPTGYRFLLAVNNSYLDGSDEARLLVEIIDGHIHAGDLEKENVEYLFHSVVVNVFDLHTVDMDGLSPRQAQAILASLNRVTYFNYLIIQTQHQGQLKYLIKTSYKSQTDDQGKIR